MQYLNRVKTLSQEEVDYENPSTFGLHGTSIEAIKYLAQHGRMPTTGSSNDKFYLFPISGDYTGLGVTDSKREAYKSARGYARINALRNHLIKTLLEKGIQLDRKLIHDLMGTVETEDLFLDFDLETELRNRLKKHLDMTENQLWDYYKNAERICLGVVLSIRGSIKNLQPFPGECEPELIVEVPDGLEIEHINGIQIMKQSEWDEIFSNDLKNIKLLY